MNIDTPLSTPTKCGCAGGIVVSCGTDNVSRNKPRHQKRLKRMRTSMAVLECPLCAHEESQNDRCYSGKADENDGIYSTTEKAIVHSRTENDSSYEKRWYSSMLRGLGIWSERKRNRSPRCRDVRIKSTTSENVYQVSNMCTNNNCKSVDRCETNHGSPSKNESIIRSSLTEVTGTLNQNKEESNKNDQKLDVDNIRHKHEIPRAEGKTSTDRFYKKSDKHLTTGIGDNCKPKTPPAAEVRRARYAGGRNGTERRIRSEGGSPRQKLPSLPYRDSGNDDKKPVTNAVIDDNKRRRGKRKYFSSPIHKKDAVRERNKVQSTYVSFQDDFADDVYMNIDSPRGIMSVSTSPASFYDRRANLCTDSPLQQSPLSLNDDVFNAPESYIGPHSAPPGGMRNHLNRNKEDPEDVRIAKLFHKVNTAFDPISQKPDKQTIMNNSFKKNRSNTCNNFHKQTDNTSGYTKCRVPSCTNRAHTEYVGEPIETIMASANLHASLDNALSMLSESTKLLTPYESHGWHHPTFNTRHLSYGGNYSSLGMGSHQQARSRTYSTCSRLETIAEENDKTDETVTDGNQNTPNTGETTSCTFSESSEYEKLYLHTSRPNSFFSSSSTFNRDSDIITSSLYRHHSEDPSKLQNRVGSRTVDLDETTKWLITTAPGGVTRNNNTSTISVRSLKRSSGSGSVYDNISGSTSTDRCTACEWVRKEHMTSTTSIPTSAWRWIAKETSHCNDKTHIHPWGICNEQHNQPVLCHSHYLQYYQYLQNDYKVHKGLRQPLHSASSQADSVIDYDIHEVMSSLDEFALSSTNSSVTNIHHSIHRNEQLLFDGNRAITSTQSSNRTQCLDMKPHTKQGSHKHSDTDVSVNSDSAFSTSGSLSPSTRDGVNTDRDSIDSIVELSGFDDHDKGTNATHEDSYYPDPWKRQYNMITEVECHALPHVQTSANRSPRGKRTQSFEGTKSNSDFTKCTLSAACHDKRYSVVSSLGSYSAPLTADTLGDSAVHLQDSSSSHSTHLSSDSFYSTGTSIGEKETCLIDGVLSTDVLSRSSSEASLKSEGTLCLSEFAKSQQNVSLFSVPSFPQISELCSPTHRKTIRESLSETLIEESDNNADFQEWVQKAEITESVLESFLNSSLAHMKELESLEISSSQPAKSYASVQNTDTLTSSSGSSDTNTLGSGSSGSTYATSSLRSYRSRFNTFDSSSCVSTDDTGDTVIDQYMLKPNGRLHDIDEAPGAQRSNSQSQKILDANRIRYQPSAFHYQNLEIPAVPLRDEQKIVQHKKSTELSNHIDIEDGRLHIAVTKDVTKNSQIIVSSPRSRSSSMSCITTFTTKACVVRQTNSLPRISFTHYQSYQAEKRSDMHQSVDVLSMKNQAKFESSLSPIYGPLLQTKVRSMMQNCANIDNVILSLRESLKTTTNSDTGYFVEKKLIELSDILKQKDEMINQLHEMLLACSVPGKQIGTHKYQTNATL